MRTASHNGRFGCTDDLDRDVSDLIFFIFCFCRAPSPFWRALLVRANLIQQTDFEPKKRGTTALRAPSYEAHDEQKLYQVHVNDIG